MTRKVAMCMVAGAMAVLVIGARPGFAQPETLIARQSVWRYFAGPATPAPDWMNPGYNDTGWSSGPGILGYGEPYITTTIPFGGNPSSVWRTTYFRHTFTLTGDPSEIETLRMTANYDDGFVVYLNGVEIARSSMPAGAITYSTFASPHEGGAYESINLTGATPFLISGTNVLAVELHQASSGSSDLVFDADLVHSVPPTVLRGPYLQMGSPGAVTVRWRTDLPTASRVTYGATPGPLSLTADDAAVTTEHEVRVTGLAPFTEYEYAIGSPGTVLAGGDPSHRFVTHPIAGTDVPTRVWVIGDAGRANNDQRAVRDAYYAYAGNRRTDLWLMLGDNAYQVGTDSEYQGAVFDMYPTLLRTSVSWPTRGNHDLLHSGAANDYYDLFTMPTAAQAGGVPSGSEAYYSFDYGDVHFICLDSEGSARSLSSPMLVWLRQDIAATDRNWIVAYWHHPPYTRGSHNSDDDFDSEGKMGDMRRNVLPILDSTGVDLVLTGHSHSYERSFLLNGHYGTSGTLAPSMIVDGGDGRIESDGAYTKLTPGTGPFEGAVYVVAGSSGGISGGSLNHPVMVESLNELGSLVLDFDGPRLDARFLSSLGVVRDSFVIVKGPTVDVPSSDAGAAFSLRVAGAQPARGAARLAYSLPGHGQARLELLDIAGRRVATLARGDHAAGEHAVSWVGLDARGRPAAAGVYFALLEWNGERRVTRIVLER